MLTFRQFVLEAAPLERHIKWAIHPHTGKVILHPHNEFNTHTDWFHHIGLPSSGHEFDRIPRGNVDISHHGRFGRQLDDFTDRTRPEGTPSPHYNTVISHLHKKGYFGRKKPTSHFFESAEFKPLSVTQAHLDHLEAHNASAERSHKEAGRKPKKFVDHHGEPLSKDVNYYGYNKGTYRVVHPGPHISLVQKTHSGRGVKVHKPELRTMGNAWLRKS